MGTQCSSSSVAGRCPNQCFLSLPFALLEGKSFPCKFELLFLCFPEILLLVAGAYWVLGSQGLDGLGQSFPFLGALVSCVWMVKNPSMASSLRLPEARSSSWAGGHFGVPVGTWAQAAIPGEFCCTILTCFSSWEHCGFMLASQRLFHRADGAKAWWSLIPSCGKSCCLPRPGKHNSVRRPQLRQLLKHSGAARSGPCVCKASTVLAVLSLRTQPWII